MSNALSFSFFDRREDGIYLNKQFEKCEILVPKSYFNDNMAVRDGQRVESLAVVTVALHAGSKKPRFFQLTLPLNIVFNTDIEPYDKYYRFDGELQQFTVLTIHGGNQVTPNSTYIQSLKDAIMFLHKFNGAKFSNIMPYDEIVRIFKDGIQKNGVSLGVPDVLISLIISELCRDSENDFKPFRFKANKTGKDEGYSLIGIKKIPQKSSVLAALAFEDMKTAIRAAVHQTRTDFEQRTAPIEKLIFS